MLLQVFILHQTSCFNLYGYPQFHAYAVFYNLQRITATKVVYFSKICDHTSFHVATLNSANVAPTCVHNVGVTNYRKLKSTSLGSIHTKLHQNLPSGSRIETCRQTGSALYVFISCTSCKEHIMLFWWNHDW